MHAHHQATGAGMRISSCRCASASAPAGLSDPRSSPRAPSWMMPRPVSPFAAAWPTRNKPGKLWPT
jgi:hypothetical protein